MTVTAEQIQQLADALARLADGDAGRGEPVIYLMGLLLAVLLVVTGFLLKSWISRIERSLDRLSEELRRGTQRIHGRMDGIETRAREEYVAQKSCELLRRTARKEGALCER